MNPYITRHIHLIFSSSNEMTEFYRSLHRDYPKFFKMDNLSKLGFLASERLLEEEPCRFTPREDVAVVCFNRSSSLETDRQYQETIEEEGNYFPSPSLFVYTLPNIVTGEIAIRNKFLGETSFYVCEEFDGQAIAEMAGSSFSDPLINRVLCAWIEACALRYEILMMDVARHAGEGLPFTTENIINLKNR